VSGIVQRFFDTLANPPTEPPPPVIPQRWRMPVFIAMVVVGIVLLTLLLWLIVVPQIQHRANGRSSNGALRQGTSAAVLAA